MPNRHSYFVSAMKFTFPLLALILIFLIFLWPNLNTEGLTFELGFSTANLQLSNKPSMINPRFYSTDSQNQHYSITADLAKRANKNSKGKENEILELKMPKADIMMKDGTWLVLTAKNGVFAKKNSQLNLSGAVNLFHDTGFEVRTETAEIDLENGAASGTTFVEGQGPFGHLSGEGFHLLNKGQTIYFTGKSKLVFHPNVKSSSQ